MAKGPKRKLNTAVGFPHLRKPPITEAVIEIRGTVGVEWNEESATSRLQELQTDYPARQSVKGFQGQWQVIQGSGPMVETKDLGLRGMRLQSADGHNVAMFTADLFSMSRLNAYQTWESLVSETLRLWKLYRDLVQQNYVNRLGVRFINRLPLEGRRVELQSYFRNFPGAIPGHDPDRLTFLYQDLISVPGEDLKANIIKTAQPGPPQDPRPALILDIDVFDDGGFTSDEAPLKTKLDKIHYWKNWIFFNTVTKSLVEKLK